MTALVFIIGLVVAALGIPGVLPWLQHRWSQRTARLSTAQKPRVIILPGPNYSLPTSPSGVVKPRPPGPSPIPTLGQLRQHACDDIERALEAVIDPSPTPGPSPSCSGCGRPGPDCRADPCWDGDGDLQPALEFWQRVNADRPPVPSPRSGRRRD